MNTSFSSFSSPQCDSSIGSITKNFNSIDRAFQTSQNPADYECYERGNNKNQKFKMKK